MTCAEFSSRLQSILDEQAQPALDAEQRTHVADCPACMQLWTAAQRLTIGLEASSPILPPLGFTARTLRRIHVRQRRLRVARWAASIAAAMGAIGLGTFVWNTGNVAHREHRADVAPLEKQVATKMAEPSVTSPAQPRFGHLRSWTGELGNELAAELREGTALFAPVPVGAEAVDSAPTRALPDLPVAEMGKSMESGLEPVTSSARRAASLWANLLPLPKDEKKKS